MKETKIDFWGWVLIISFLIVLSISGYISYKSIDYKILPKLESQQLVLPTPAPLNPATPSAQTATSTPSAATK